MRAVVLTAPKTPLQVDARYPDPAPTGDEVVIEVTACGVCHSDIHAADGEYPNTLPVVLGHEVTGVDDDLGPVMVYAPWGCLDCDMCAAGLEMMCPNGSEAGLVVDGGYAERMLVRDRSYLAPLGDLDPVAAAPLGCGGLTAYRAVDHTLARLRQVGSGGRAMIIGAGGLGQFAIRYLTVLSDADVVAVDVNAAKQATALAIGATEAVDSVDDLEPVDAVIDFTGVQATIEAARDSLRRRGVAVIVGLGGGRIPFGFGAVPHESQWMTSVWGSRGQLDELLDLARREPSIVQPVETLPLDQAQAAHDRLRAGDARGRIVLTTNERAANNHTNNNTNNRNTTPNITNSSTPVPPTAHTNKPRATDPADATKEHQ